VAEAVQRLIGSEWDLSPQIEEAIVAHGAAAIAPLLEMLESTEDDFSAVHAARLLGVLKAEAAIERLIEIVVASDWEDMLHDRAILALGEIGPAIVEPVLARLQGIDGTDDDDEVRPALLGALASCGADDERVYQALVQGFERHAWRYACELAEYGDDRAIPVISKALDESRFGIDREDLRDHAVIDLCDSIEELGGELTSAQQQRVEQVREKLEAERAAESSLTGDDAELADFLDSSEGSMSFAEAKGYLTAIVTGPTLTPPSVWLDVVLGEEPDFDSQEHADRIFGLLIALNNKQSDALAAGEQVSTDEDVEEWCAGYCEAVHMDAAWTADEDSLIYVFPMSALSGEFSLVGNTDANGKVIEDPTPQLRACLARLDQTAHDGYQYWLAKRRPSVPVTRSSPKVGRNEPCPCGSGKKFKKCCGAPN
jgi:uncharacterized protein